MKKLTRSDLETLKETLPVLDYDAMMEIMGGYDDRDCWWRCVAYLKYGGLYASRSDAMALACAYYGSNFDSNNYAFSGTPQDYRDYISTLTGSGDSYPGKILVYKVEGSDMYHAVVIVTPPSGASGAFDVFDPQNGQFYNIAKSTLGGSYFVVEV
jgi:hypothetical protein